MTLSILNINLCFVSDITDQVNKALENIVEGVVHPLKIRIEKIVTVSAPSTSFYAVKSLIQFYKTAIQEVKLIFISLLL